MSVLNVKLLIVSRGRKNHILDNVMILHHTETSSRSRTPLTTTVLPLDSTVSASFTQTAIGEWEHVFKGRPGEDAKYTKVQVQ